MDNINSIINNYIICPKKNEYKFKKNYLSNNEIKYFKNPIGLFDPYGENINPLTNKPYENLYKHKEMEYKSGPLKGQIVPITYKSLAYNWTQLEVYKFLDPILESINKYQVTIIKANTGVGKTVIIPKILLQAFNFQKKIICTVPKQITAKENAEYSAKCLDVNLGNEVGFFFMGNNKTNDNTKLIFTTPGSLKSKITRGDPYLSEYGGIIIDEIHERSVQTDQLLLMMKDVLIKRPDFRLLLISATVDLTIFKDYFTKKSNFNYNEIEILGKTYDVKIYFEKKVLKDWKSETVSKILNILNTTVKGDILVFVKSGGDGNMICEDLKRKSKNIKNINPFCVTLESKTSDQNRNYAMKEFNYLSHPNMDPNNPYTRKIVMATNVAESSLTVDGIVYVIDNGFELESSFFPEENAKSLIEERISRSSATQRSGRAGRTMDGYCYRLYTEEEYNKFHEYPIPEIQKTDLTSDILDIYLLEYIKNTKDVRNFLNNLISPPHEKFIISALSKLYALGAINNISDEGEITEMGRAISQFRAIEPNLAKSILASYYYFCKRDVINIILIAMQIDGRIDNLFEKYRPKDKFLSNKDKLREESEYIKIQKSFYSSYGDYLTILNVYEKLKEYMKTSEEPNPKMWCKMNGIASRVFIRRDYKKTKEWDLILDKSRKISDTLRKIVRPPELIKEHYEEYKKDGGIENLNQINKEIKYLKNQIIDSENNILETVLINKNLANKFIMEGGYKSKSYEINLFPDINKYNSNEKNILMALSIGNITNLAKLHMSKKKIYKSCFPMKKVNCKFDQNTTLKTNPSIVLYNELFMRRKNENILKLNLVTKIPNDILSYLKNKYNDFIKICFEKENTYKNITQQSKQKSKQTSKQNSKQISKQKSKQNSKQTPKQTQKLKKQKK
jgi:HrpA-like RNA helicase